MSATPAEREWATQLINANNKLSEIYGYIFPWIGLTFSSFAFVSLIIRNRGDQNLLIFLFKWQYALCIIYSLNMAFLDNRFTVYITKYTFTLYISDGTCKVVNMLKNFIYCVPTWLQVIITFDRLWSIFLTNKIKLKRNKINIFVIIVALMTLVLIINQVHMAYYAIDARFANPEFNSSLNRTIVVFFNSTRCIQTNLNVTLAQDLVFIIVRVILPFLIMVICNVILIRHIAQSRNRVIRGRDQKREHSFTITVTILNGSFLTFNIGAVTSFVITYYIRFSGNGFSYIGGYINSIFLTVSILVSYSYPLLQFWMDLFFNKIFRKEIGETFLILTGRGNQVNEETQTRTQPNAQRKTNQAPQNT